MVVLSLTFLYLIFYFLFFVTEDRQRALTAKEKKGKFQSLKKALKSFRMRLDTTVRELGNAREIKRRGLLGRRRGLGRWRRKPEQKM